MKKIGQITLYDYNYGSALQCYATQQILKKLGYECVLFREQVRSRLKYKILYITKAGVKTVAYPKYIKEFYRMMQSQRKTALSSFVEQDFLGIQKFIHEDIESVTLDYREMVEEAKKEDYVAFISGSDQVWNGSWFLRNDAYFLRFAPKEKRIAWAPSFGADTIAEYNLRRMRKDIGNYRFLSTRELSGVGIVKELTGRNAVRIIDPVLQLTAEQWRNSYENKEDSIAPCRYVFCYFLNEPNSKALNYLKLKANEGFTILAFASRYECLQEIKNVVFTGGSPWNYLYLLGHADYVCSDSFHALAFSIVFHKKMLIFHRQYTHSTDQSGRIKSLLNQLKIPDRFIGLGDDVPNVENEMDFDYMDRVLLDEGINAATYLLSALHDCEASL